MLHHLNKWESLDFHDNYSTLYEDRFCVEGSGLADVVE